MQHTFIELGVILRKRSLPDDEHDVEVTCNLRLMMADNLLDQPSHPVADYGIPDLLADGYAHPEPLYLSARKPIHYILMIRK